MKPDDVKIIHIAVGAGEAAIYGLGDDNQVYTWTSEGEWTLHILG